MAATEGVMAAAFAAGGVELADAVPAPAPTTRRSRASAPTAPTCGSGWRSATSATRCGGTEFKVFRGVLEGGGVVRGINAGAHELSRAELDRLIEFAQGQGAGGLVWAYVEEGGGWRSPVAKFLSDARAWRAMAAALEASPGDLLLLVADEAGVAAQTLGALRLELARSVRADRRRASGARCG